MKAHVNEAARREVIRPVAKTIRVIARDRNVTMVELAGVLGVTEQSFYAKLNGKAPVGLEELDALAKKLGVSAAQLLEPINVLEWVAGESNPEPADNVVTATPVALSEHAKPLHGKRSAARSSAAA